MIRYVFLILLALLADRLTKTWAAAFLIDNGPVALHPLLTLRPIYNGGMASGLFQGIAPALGWLTVVIVLGLFVSLYHIPRTQWLLRAGTALVIGGALGNQIDRITAGHVLDFIEISSQAGIFNIADVIIQLGLLLSVAGAFWNRPLAAEPVPVLEEE